MDWKKFLLSLTLVFFVAWAGSTVTMPSISTWYAQLNKPWFSPPNWVFGPVWTILYLAMAISYYLVWNKLTNKNTLRIKEALRIFQWQLLVNFLWSYAFFGLQQIALAFAVIVVLWVLIWQTIQRFKKFDQLASWLLYPYIAWVSFASLLNVAIAVLN